MESIKTDIVGLSIIPEYITTEEEEELIDLIKQQPWDTTLQRLTQHYGYRYDYRSSLVTGGDVLPIPDWLKPYVDRLILDHHIVILPEQVIINRYLPGQGIGKHVDSYRFGNKIYSISLGSGCTMIFINCHGKPKEFYIKPRSLMIIKDDARYKYTHSIPGVKRDFVLDSNDKSQKIERTTRYSITFRNIEK